MSSVTDSSKSLDSDPPYPENQLGLGWDILEEMERQCRPASPLEGKRIELRMIFFTYKMKDIQSSGSSGPMLGPVLADISAKTNAATPVANMPNKTSTCELKPREVHNMPTHEAIRQGAHAREGGENVSRRRKLMEI